MSFYEILNSIWRRERQSRKLITLEEDFFEKARAYLNHLENQTQNEQDDLIKELFRKRLDQATYLVNDLTDLRIEKHIRETLSGEFRDHSDHGLPYEEKEFRTRLEKLTKTFRETIHGINEFEEDSDSYELIQMSKAENISSVGADLKTYGPFKPKDLVFLPVENAKILIQTSKAEKIDI